MKAKRLELFIDTFDVSNEDVIADALKLRPGLRQPAEQRREVYPRRRTVNSASSQQTTFHRGYGDYVFLVKDNGIGMSPDFVEHIFEPFEREASATKSASRDRAGYGDHQEHCGDDGRRYIRPEREGPGHEFRVELSLRLQDVEKNAAQIKELEGLRTLWWTTTATAARA